MTTTASAPSFELMTNKDVERDYGFPLNTLRYWRTTGRGPKAAKIGGRVMYRRTDVEAWIDAQFDGQDGAA